MKVAVLGYGTVGKAVTELLLGSERLSLGGVLVRKGKAALPFHTDDPSSLLAGEDVYAVVEVLGGIEPAFSYAKAALRSGKHLVTANKALVAAHGLALAALARENNVAFRFTAACGGALPYLRHLALARDSEGGITNLGGILNGTTNFILSSMENGGQSIPDAVRRAQALGYAEADPTDDLNGTDTARKLALACAVAFDALPSPDGILREGICAFSPDSAADLRARGLTVRLCAKGAMTADGLCAFVEPTVFPLSAAEARVTGSGNYAWAEGCSSGRVAFSGAGAGGAPTASNVLRDLLEIEAGCGEMLSPACREVQTNNSGAVRRYYLFGDACALPALEEERRPGTQVSGWYKQPCSPAGIHALAAEWRKRGEVFFAGTEA